MQRPRFKEARDRDNGHHSSNQRSAYKDPRNDAENVVELSSVREL